MQHHTQAHHFSIEKELTTPLINAEGVKAGSVTDCRYSKSKLIIFTKLEYLFENHDPLYNVQYIVLGHYTHCFPEGGRTTQHLRLYHDHLPVLCQKLNSALSPLEWNSSNSTEGETNSDLAYNHRSEWSSESW
jgi:hypothetical protein